MARLLRIPLGQVVATPGVIAAIPNAEMMRALARHARGDWGELCPEDAQENELWSFRLLSAYTSSAGVKFWIITEADRSATTFLLPAEY